MATLTTSQTTYKSSASIRIRKALTRIAQYGTLILFSLLIVVPIYLMFVGGLKSRGELATTPYQLPSPVRWDNWVSVLEKPEFWRMMTNSLIVMIATAVGVVLIAGLTAFVLSRLQFKAKNWVFNYFNLGLLFPMAVAVLPLYILLRSMSLINNHMGIILPQVAFGLAGNILILRGFFQGVPSELQDAAYMDGCTDLGFFWYILLPITRPALAAVAVLVMIASWNELFLPLLILDKDTLWTLPLGTMQFTGQYGQERQLVLAFVTLTMIPTIVFYILAERQIVEGLTAGAVKG